MEKICYSCASCCATFWKVILFGKASEEAKCPHCGAIAHRNRLQELSEDLKNRLGI